MTDSKTSAHETGEHLSDLQLDRLLADELPPEAIGSHNLHLSQCHRCESRLEALRRESRAAQQDLPGFASIEQAARAANRSKSSGLRRWLKTLVPVAAPLCLAAAVLLVMIMRAPTDDVETTGVRTKGNALLLGFYVKTKSGVRTGESGQTLKPGDAVRFFYDSPSQRYLAIISQDGAGQVSVYYADGGRGALAPKGNHELDESVTLDDVPGKERIYAFFCTKNFPISRAFDTLEAYPDRPFLAGCETRQLHWVKVARESTP